MWYKLCIDICRNALECWDRLGYYPCVLVHCIHVSDYKNLVKLCKLDTMQRLVSILLSVHINLCNADRLFKYS